MMTTDTAPKKADKQKKKLEKAKAAAESGKGAEAANAAATAGAKSRDVLLGLDCKKAEDFSRWYQQVLLRAEMLEYYDISGCYIIRPWAMSIWQQIQTFFQGEIEKLGVEPCYFPMFVSEARLKKEASHIEGFSPEVAWVTKAGDSDLQEPIALRPTSETVMYPAFSKWINSHRDLPLKLNQWCNIIRWEFKHPQPFLRTREFLWQEGHTAFLNREEADEEVRVILKLYARVYEDLLAVPVIQGVKSVKEKFAGGDYTTTVEAYIPTSGRAIQGGTSHSLGQNFSKMFDIQVENEQNEKQYVYQNSWGLTTRTIGVMIMIHGDDKGLILPPRVAQVQAILMACGITAKTTQEDKDALFKAITEVHERLKKAGLRTKLDLRENYTPGFKFNYWEIKGVPLRIEMGPRDLKNSSIFVCRRDTGKKTSYPLENIETSIPELLESFQKDLYDRALKAQDEGVVKVTSWDNVVQTLDSGKLVLGPWCETTECEDKIKKDSERVQDDSVPMDERAPSMGAKSLCLPFEQEPIEPDTVACFGKDCQLKAKRWALFGRSY